MRGLAPKDIPYVSVGSFGVWYEEPLPAVAISEYCGLTGAGLARVEAACSTGSAAILTAYTAVMSGYVD
jgi:acetyl-CoA C-acetyltransferase